MLKTTKKFYNTISFKSWIYFFSFSIAIIILIAIFQLYLIEPEYLQLEKDNLIETINTIISIRNNDQYTEFQKNYQTEVNSYVNNSCIVIITEDEKITIIDGMVENTSSLYHLNNNIKILNTDYIQYIFFNNNSNFTIAKSSDIEHLFYRYIDESTNSTYYAEITLQSMNKVLKVTQNQLLNLIFLTLILSSFISILFSRFISKPIKDINNEAKKLSNGQFDLQLNKTNISELDELVDTLIISSNELGELDTIKSEIVQNVAHDIRTPLTMIKAYAELVKDYSYKDDNKRGEHLGIIIDETNNLSDYVEKTLNLSKLEKGIAKPVMKEFDLTTMVTRLIERINTSIADENVIVELNCELELVAYGDQSNIREVLNNFISNAINHVGDDKKVIVNALLKDLDTIYVEIKDNGEGISPDLMPKLWNRYIKSNKQYKRSNQSHGLGLAINKAILDAHESEYGVISEVGKGTTFYFTLKTRL